MIRRLTLMSPLSPLLPLMLSAFPLQAAAAGDAERRAVTPPMAWNKLAATPPMGWNSWNHFAARVSDAVVRAQADAMVASGMRDVGYVYVNIDDTWEGKRDSTGIIHPNEKFPDMKALADYVHGKGLKLGLYSSPGTKTCAGYEGSYGHEEQDARTYAEWGIDYLKYDLCALTEPMAKAGSAEKARQIMQDAYLRMSRALRKSGRPIVYSLCQYGWNSVWQWGASVGGNLWRTQGDIEDKYRSMEIIGFSQLAMAQYAGPGHWNDPDMLEVGNGGMTTEEYRTHMSLWALLAAPLIAGNDLTTMEPQTLRLLTDRDVIAIDQDALGKQAQRAWARGLIEVWTRPLRDHSVAIGFFNRADPDTSEAQVAIPFRELGVSETVQARDIWQKKNLGVVKQTARVRIPPHGVVLWRVRSP